MTSGVSGSSGTMVYTADTTVDEVVENEMGQLAGHSHLTKDEKLAKIARAEVIIHKISDQVPMTKLLRDMEDLKDKISKGVEVDSNHKAVKRCKLLFKRIIGMIKDLEDGHPLLKDVPERFLIFRDR